MFKSITRLKKFIKPEGYQVPAWHKAFTAHLHIPFKNGSVPQRDNHIRDEDGIGQLLEEDIEHFMYDPRRGACSLGEDSSYSDSNGLLQAQSYKSSQDEEDIKRVVIERIYLDDVAIPAFLEEGISKHKRPFLKGLHSSEVITKTSGYVDIQEPYQLPSHGFIDTAGILKESEYNKTEERNLNQKYKTVQVFNRKEAHEEVEWKANYKSKSIGDAEEQSSQALTVKIEADSAKDHGAGAPFRNISQKPGGHQSEHTIWVT